ncbi:hypothetical protein EXX41_13410 [Escherichia coli]|nr:hypothetical protein EXX41_13410 [Escherichia coli]
MAPEVNAKALAWGKQYENDARALFEFTSGVNVTESPIIYRDESMRTACSPDGLCSDGNGLELKCPFAPNHLTEHARKIDDIFGDNVPNMSHSGIMEDIKKA